MRRRPNSETQDERRMSLTYHSAYYELSLTYASSSGLQVEFNPTAVVLDCGDAHVMRPYSVDNGASGLVVTIRNGTVPVALTLGASGAPTGSGTVEVAGRVVTGTNATYAPRTARCAVGDLRPR